MKRYFLIAAVALYPQFARGQSFTGLGIMAGGTNTTAAHISGDGLVVVGNGNVSDLQFHSFRWTASAGLEDIGALPGAINSNAWGVNHDGSVIVGDSGRAFRWSRSTGMLPLQVTTTSTQARGVSDDGSVIAGTIGDYAFRWTQSGGYETLGILPGGYRSAAFAISGDGNVIAGTSFGGGNRPFIWTRAGGLRAIGFIGTGYPQSTAKDISTDGTTVIGDGFDGSEERAFRWRSSTGLIEIGMLPGKTQAEVNGTNADGSVIVGLCWSNGSADPFVATMWSDALGIVDLNEYLPTLGIDLTGWRLTYASDVSDDGLTITGFGLHDGITESWVASLGCRSDFNHDGTVDLFDYMDFVAAFDSNEPRSDFNLDGTIDFFDYLDFLMPFNAGC